jgi:dsRNA-specific ribonuclease
LRHSTLGNERKLRHNQELATLGDAVLGFALRRAFYKRGWSKGQITTAVSRLASDVALWAKARDELHLEQCLEYSNLADPADKTPLAEAFEAILGAIYLDADQHAFDVVEALFRTEIESEAASSS